MVVFFECFLYVRFCVRFFVCVFLFSFYNNVGRGVRCFYFKEREIEIQRGQTIDLQVFSGRSWDLNLVVFFIFCVFDCRVILFVKSVIVLYIFEFFGVVEIQSWGQVEKGGGLEEDMCFISKGYSYWKERQLELRMQRKLSMRERSRFRSFVRSVLVVGFLRLL